MTSYDPSLVGTPDLLRSYRFHLNDLTESNEEEIRRMYLLGVITVELERRGVIPIK